MHPATVLLFVGYAAAICVDNALDCTYVTSNWTECDPCKEYRSRSVTITQPRHGVGSFCPAQPAEYEPCVPSGPCSEFTCDEATFHCASSGRCIRKDLICNGEDDCGDYSDETNCTDAQIAGRQSFIQDCVSLPALPFINLPGSGINIMTGDYLGDLLDNDYYDGLCKKLYDPDSNTVYRKPYNLDSVHFQVKADGQVTSKSYSSFHSYKSDQESSSDDSFHLDVGGSYSFVSASMSLKWSQSKSHKQIFDSMKSGKSSLYEISSRVELAQFQLRNKGLMVSPGFRQAVSRLPVDYNPQAYLDLLNQFGTHFISEGTMGGMLRYYYTVDEETQAQSGLTEDKFKSCLSVEASVSFFSVASVSSGYSHCKANSDSVSTSDHMASMASSTISDNQGGTSDAAYLFVSSQNDTDNFKNWVQSIKSNPTILTRKMRVICDLITETKVPKSDIIAKNCQQALWSYLQHNNPGNCRSCLNGGMPVSINQTCYCACPDGTVGEMCQLLQDRSLKIPTSNPYPFLVVKTDAEDGIQNLRMKANKIYALRESGVLNVYNNDPYQGIKLQSVMSVPTEEQMGVGFDIDSEGAVWTFIRDTNHLIRIHPNGTLLTRLTSEDISNYCWKPTDITTTCDDLIIITDKCNSNGRFFVLSHNGTSVNVEQYNDGGELLEAPQRVTYGPGEYLYFTSENYITIYTRTSRYTPFQFIGSFQHHAQFPGQVFVDQNRRLFLSTSMTKGDVNNFMGIYQTNTNTTDYTLWSFLSTSLWTGGCEGLAGSGSDIITSCHSPGLTVFRTI